MTRCFAEPSRWTETEITLCDEEARHLVQVLRLGPGQAVTVFDGKGRTAQAEIATVGRKDARLKILETQNDPRPGLEVHLFQAVLKSQKMDWVVQKAAELGVAVIHPVLTERTVVKIKARQGDEKVSRWNKITLNAAKQCGGNWLTAVEAAAPFSGLAGRISDFDLFLVGALHPEAIALPDLFSRTRLADLKKVGVLIGPEGDFAPEEYEQLTRTGARFVSLGDRVLRAETAAIFALGVLSYESSRCMIGPCGPTAIDPSSPA